MYHKVKISQKLREGICYTSNGPASRIESHMAAEGWRCGGMSTRAGGRGRSGREGEGGSGQHGRGDRNRYMAIVHRAGAATRKTEDRQKCNRGSWDTDEARGWVQGA